MNITIKQTNEATNLYYYNEEMCNDQNIALMIVDSAGATDDGQFVYDDELDTFIASAETVEWWEAYLVELGRAEAARAELVATLDEDDINTALDAIHKALVGVEINDIPNAMNSIVLELTEEYTV